MPFWHGEYMARSLMLSHRVGALRRELAEAPSEERLRVEYGCDAATSNSLVRYIASQRAATGVVPDDRNIVIEQFRDETGAVRVVIHAAYGGRINAPWGMALAQRVREAINDTDLQIQTTDDGIMLRLPDLGMSTPIQSLLGLSGAEAEQLVMEEVGSTSLFGARFRMNAARALLLPRGNPRRRMPLWLQRLKSLDLLEVVRQFPSFPILVETYREVLQDAFDMKGLKEVLAEIASGAIRIHAVQTDAPSPFAASLQFGFVMDWLYGDDTPRAEQRAALLSIDRSLLDEVMGGEGRDDITREAIEQTLAERRGTVAGRRARTDDELAHLLDRAGDLDATELGARIESEDEGARVDPLTKLLETRRVIAIPLGPSGSEEWRFILTETYPRYVSAFGADQLRIVPGTVELTEGDAADLVPDVLRHAAMNPSVARREILARFLTQSGPVTALEIQARYGWQRDWIESRLTEWERTGKLIRGKFRREVQDIEWCSRRLVEIGRRRALAALRRQIEAVELPAFAAFMQRWQHLDERDRLDGGGGAETVIRQLYGISRPPVAWDRDYLRARVKGYDPGSLSRFTATGEPVWAGEGNYDPETGAIPLARVRLFERGTGAIWLPDQVESVLSENAERVKATIAEEGASFIGDIQAITGLTMLAVREAIRELVAWGLVTNDTVEALREIARWKPMLPRTGVDPTSWLPPNYTPSPNRRFTRTRPNLRRLPKWRRPDKPGSAPSGWTGRWSLVRRRGTMGPEIPEEERAERIARQWLARYGIVSRDWWRRERPPVSWRAIYRELKRLEFRGEVRRGYFVKGLGGAQFALPDAVEWLRTVAGEDQSTSAFVVMAASDPANVYNLPLELVERDPLSRPRGSGAVLVTRGGKVAIAVEARGKRFTVADWLTPDEVAAAKKALVEHLRGERSARYVV
jgi:ATP-dependent Lhr-like helicase